MRFTGTVRRFGDDINTDYIISSKRKRDTIDVDILKRYIMEDIRPGFYDEIAPGDIIVAGRDFGCGSAMEQAAQVIRAAEIPIVIAQSFSRMFYRNAINNGVYLATCDTAGIAEGAQLSVHIDATHILIDVDGAQRSAPPIADFLRAILAEGGIIPYFRKFGRFPAAP